MMISAAYEWLYRIALGVLGISLFFSLFRSIRGPRIADRIVAVNMVGTQVTIIIAIPTLVLGESYLADVALIYTMLSFLAVVLLTKVYTGVYREQMEKQKTKEEKTDA